MSREYGAVCVVPLQFSASDEHGHRAVKLRELTGNIERAVSSTSTADAMCLIDSLIVGELGRRQAKDLTASDRDRLLAMIYQQAFGDRIESTLTCAVCSQPFDIDFSIEELMTSLFEHRSSSYQVLEDGRIETSDGISFRLPTGGDELAIVGLSPDDASSTLLERCIGESPSLEQDAFEELLDEIAPLLDLDLAASCPECGQPHSVEFDIQSYLLGAILGERRQLLSAIHRLASAYQWPLDEILSLTRSERRSLVDMIEGDSVYESGGGSFGL